MCPAKEIQLPTLLSLFLQSVESNVNYTSLGYVATLVQLNTSSFEYFAIQSKVRILSMPKFTPVRGEKYANVLYSCFEV